MDVTPKTVIEARCRMAMFGVEMLSKFWKDEHNVKD